MNVKVRKQSSAGLHCVKSFRIPIFPGPYYPAFMSECGKIRTRKNSGTDTFQAVLLLDYKYILRPTDYLADDGYSKKEIFTKFIIKINP